MLKTKTKRLFLASILFFLFFSLTVPALAADPLVKCGNAGQAACTLNDFFSMVQGVVDFILYDIVPPLAVITVVFAAVNLMTSSGDPGKLEQAKKTIIWIIIGLVVIYGAWALVKGFITALGGQDWTFQFFKQ